MCYRITVAALLVSLAACSKSSGSSSTGGTGASATINQSGGTVASPDGNSVQVPPDALGSAVQITITPSPNAPPPANTTVVGTPVTLGPEGQHFSTPVTVTLGFSPSMVPAGGHVVMFTAPAGSTVFTSLGGTLVDATHVQATTTHFSTVVPGVASAGACEVCVQGRCANLCPDGQTACSAVCTDLGTDRNNCGSCGAVCPSDQTCSQGACEIACGRVSSSSCLGSSSPDGGTSCTSPCSACHQGCADFSSDTSNCGACGNACGSGQICSGGVCGPECPSGQLCAQGACAPACSSGTTECNGVCVDTQSDYQNCGACDAVCSSGLGCYHGACAQSCNATQQGACGGSNDDCHAPCLACGNACVAPQADPNNCGSCGHVCPFTYTCLAGVCTTNCPAGQACDQGVCTSGCGPGEAMCGATCVDVENDAANCGSCNSPCPAGHGCYEGACVTACGSSVDAGGVTNSGTSAGTSGGGSSGGTSGCSAPAMDCMTEPPNGTPCCNVGAQCTSASPTTCDYQCVCTAGGVQCGPCGGSDGGAACAPPRLLCSTDCVDPTMDPQNCGSCGRHCVSGFCNAGVCGTGATDGGATCLPPQLQCSGVCVDIQSDSQNCGGCGFVCSVGLTCNNSVCS